MSDGKSEFHKPWKAYRSDLSDYMHRWIFRSPWGTLRLHHILKSDEGRDFHDHPFRFTSLILTGEYLEHVPGCRCTIPIAVPNAHSTPHPDGPCRFYGPGSIVRREATALHRLELTKGPALTAVMTGPYFRRWGFQTPQGWVDFEQYNRTYYKQGT